MVRLHEDGRQRRRRVESAEDREDKAENDDGGSSGCSGYVQYPPLWGGWSADGDPHGFPAFVMERAGSKRQTNTNRQTVVSGFEC